MRSLCVVIVNVLVIAAVGPGLNSGPLAKCHLKHLNTLQMVSLDSLVLKTFPINYGQVQKLTDQGSLTS